MVKESGQSSWIVHLFESEIKLLVIMTIPYNTAHMEIQENKHQHYCQNILEFTHVQYIASYSYMTLCACAW